jgi:hypothetical protein
LQQFSLDAALSAGQGEPATLSLPLRKQLYRHYMSEARKIADRLRNEPEAKLRILEGELGDLQFFAMPDDDRQPH